MGGSSSHCSECRPEAFDTLFALGFGEFVGLGEDDSEGHRFRRASPMKACRSMR